MIRWVHCHKEWRCGYPKAILKFFHNSGKAGNRSKDLSRSMNSLANKPVTCIKEKKRKRFDKNYNLDHFVKPFCIFRYFWLWRWSVLQLSVWLGTGVILLQTSNWIFIQIKYFVLFSKWNHTSLFKFYNKQDWRRVKTILVDVTS